jgi:hypothetical protein
VLKNEVLTAQSSDREQCAFGVILVPQDEINNLGDGAGAVRGAVSVTDRDWGGQRPGGHPIRLDIVMIDEAACSSQVHQGIKRLNFPSVCGFNANLHFKDRVLPSSISLRAAMTNSSGRCLSQQGRDLFSGCGSLMGCTT